MLAAKVKTSPSRFSAGSDGITAKGQTTVEKVSRQRLDPTGLSQHRVASNLRNSQNLYKPEFHGISFNSDDA
jgi:hypothetical protein